MMKFVSWILYVARNTHHFYFLFIDWVILSSYYIILLNNNLNIIDHLCLKVKQMATLNFLFLNYVREFYGWTDWSATWYKSNNIFWNNSITTSYNVTKPIWDVSNFEKIPPRLNKGRAKRALSVRWLCKKFEGFNFAGC